jgi:eukaryotic translation initiation factor 2C
MVTDLKDMMIERLKAFQLKSTKYPERILVYRDGVSEVNTNNSNLKILTNLPFQGQFESVLEEELPAIIAACKAVNMKARPKLTIVVCVRALSLNSRLCNLLIEL